MTVPEEASDLWLFDSHKSSKRSQWLQSTLSELEEKTKGMLKLIEGDADTFAQRAEMYYRKRPELVRTIEDFYRAYRSLAERHDQLRMESGCAFSNRGWLFKDWNSSTDKSSESSSVVSEYMVSEVDDPDSEDDQVESRLREVVPKKSGSGPTVVTNEVGQEERFKGNISEVDAAFTNNPIDSVLPEAVNLSKLGEYEIQLSVGGATNPVTEEVKKNIERTDTTTCKDSDVVLGEPDESSSSPQQGKDPLSSRCLQSGIEAAVGRIIHSKVKIIREESSSTFADPLEKRSGGGDVVKRLEEEKVSLVAEIERKDDEKREVIRQLSLAMDMLREENVCMKKFIKDSSSSSSSSRTRTSSAAPLFNLKGAFCGKLQLFGSRSKYQTTLVAL